MKLLTIGIAVAALGVIPAVAQSLDDLNIQIHGYATQGFLYTNHNNVFTTESSNGSPAWTDAVVNLTAQPSSSLRVGVQARYFLLGNFGNAITLDWASADYKAGESFGVRFGKVKTPMFLFNDIQDIDPSYMWALLPQSNYPVSSRNTVLAHYGGVLYGTVRLDRAGKLDYDAWGGERVIPADDGYLLGFREEGLALPNGLGGATWGAALHWRTPIQGLMAGASDSKNELWHANVTAAGGALSGNVQANPFNYMGYFARYEKNKVMVAAEVSRLPTSGVAAIPGVFSLSLLSDERAWYAMAAYKVTSKLTAGAYQSQFFDRKLPLGPGRYSKDWTVSGRYDFNEFLYAKAEQHFIDGTDLDYDWTTNGLMPGSPSQAKYPTSRLSVLKIGVSF